ncbi:MAG: DNA (cytosine-5-)-methyltransferase [Bacteroidales bacterium]|nr:DNA (cytosine-5-)-methyltransferase [Bacteroidales bacterium]
MFISESNLAALTGTSIASTHSWWKRGLYPPKTNEKGIRGFEMEDLASIPEVNEMLNSRWNEERDVKPLRRFTSIELFAGGGGLALGMEKAGFTHVLLNEFEKAACNTLKINRPHWNVIEGDVRNIDFTPLRGKVDFLSGGFPCQAFSYAGKQGGFNDTRGTLFFELARAVDEIRPKVFMGENVKGLLSHENGKTLATIRQAIDDLGYTLVEPRILKGIMYQVPQKRERLILIAIRNDIAEKVKFHWPTPFSRVLTLRDAFYKGIIFDKDVPSSEGVSYPEKKQKVMQLVPEGGDWRDLPEHIAQEYMGGSWNLGGGKTGMARRLSLEEPSLTLTCSPCQKQTERCHPLETRPLNIREYARIQTFPDEWKFMGTMSDKYKQIGNAVPVNLAWAIGRSLIRLMNDIQTIMPDETANYTDAVKEIVNAQSELVVIKDKKTQTATVVKGTKQLSFASLFDEYALSPIVENNFVCETTEEYNAQSKNKSLDLTKNVLVSLVKPKESLSFTERTATVYYSGKRFPATVSLSNLFYFVPYIKGKGIKDLWIIKKARIGQKGEGTKKVGENCAIEDMRLIFELEFVSQLFDDYKPIDLKIWHTFTDSNLNQIIEQE